MRPGRPPHRRRREGAQDGTIPARSRSPQPHRPLVLSDTYPVQEHTMYDMYPDWGPARHYGETSGHADALQQALDLRDNGGQRPDDN